MKTKAVLGTTTGLFLLLLSPARGEKAGGLAFFESKIRPVLVKSCYECHSSQSRSPKGKLLLDTREGLLQGGASGPAVVPGNLEESTLILALRHEVGEMPPDGKLPDAVIADFERWVMMGAPDPREGTPAVVREEVADPQAGREFWAFRPPTRHRPPPVRDEGWPRTEIDRFVLAGLEANALRPVEDADRVTLIRRASFDLTGLPPRRPEVEAFLADDAPDAYARVVDRLLAAPQFGERWGRHWLDLVRYAESTGKSRNIMFKAAWRYRDYVIDAFNADKPYDRFLVEQLAGDLLPARDAAHRNELLVATGLLAIGPKEVDDRPEQYVMDIVDDQIDVTCRAFLGLTVSCARCHDHKFDPIPTADYYALAGIFKSTRLYPGVRRGLRAPSEADLLPPARTAEPLSDGERQALAKHLGERDRLLATLGNPAQAKKIDADEVKTKLAMVEARLDELGCRPRELLMAASDVPEPADCRVCVRGDVANPGPIAPRGFLRVLTAGDVRVDPAHSGRLELARWLTGRDNPLTARVMVNRVWAHLFGRGLVETTDNFGFRGTPPSHPELLDDLAIRFMEGGWSVKRLVREIMLSRVYQLDSGPDANNAERDQGNRWLWRQNRRRLEGEAIRDALLAAGGQLDLGRPVGSPVQEVSNREVSAGAAIPKDIAILGKERPCRSVYLPDVRGLVPEFLAIFDAADPNLVIGQREVTTVPHQTLFLLNSPFVLEQADRLARSLLASRPAGDAPARVEEAFWRVLGRSPSASECRRALGYLDVARHRIGEPDGADAEVDAWASLCQGLFLNAEFRYVF